VRPLHECTVMSHRCLVNRASPRLKDAQLSVTECSGLYEELISVMRTMFHQCKLVHADLSEYNILYREGHLWIIDVSQSVEHDHPSAFDFLRNDIKNVEEFFGRLGVRCLGLRRCFEFITFDGSADEASLETWLMEEESSADSDVIQGDGSQHEDSVFLQSFIPRTLNEVFDPERDVAKLNRGEGDGLIYAKTIGLVAPTPSDIVEEHLDSAKQEEKPLDAGVLKFSNNDLDDDHDSQITEELELEDDDTEGESGSTGGGFIDRKPRGHRHENRDAKKVYCNNCFAHCVDASFRKGRKL
jgi:RIO kinase 1